MTNAVVTEKRTLKGCDGAATSEKLVATTVLVPIVAESIPHPEHVTMDRRKGKLGGAQRVNRNGDNRKVRKFLRYI